MEVSISSSEVLKPFETIEGWVTIYSQVPVIYTNKPLNQTDSTYLSF